LCSLQLAKRHGSEDEAIGAAEIAEHNLIPIQYTQQILQRLRKGGIIDSIRGPKGGYKLVASPELISIKQILVAAEGDTFQIICESSITATFCAPGNTCGLRAIWTDLRNVIDQFLDSRSLAWLLENTVAASEAKVNIRFKEQSQA